MTIKNKDGSIFTLSKPNPVMRQQDLWDDGSQFILHNFKYDEVILHNFDAKEEEKPKEEPKPQPEPMPTPKPVKKFQALDEITPEEINVPVRETPVPQQDKVRKKRQPTKNINILYCLPAITVSNHDPLYNESHVSVNYGQQFTFESVITGSTDLMLQLWTNKEIVRHSILYQPTSRRWWKVESVVQRTDGFTVDCTPSPLQPSFRLQP